MIHDYGIVKLLVSTTGSPLNLGTRARRKSNLTQLPVVVFLKLFVKIETEATLPEFEYLTRTRPLPLGPPGGWQLLA